MRTKAGALLVSLGMLVAVPSGIAVAQVDDGTATLEETVENTTEDTVETTIEDTDSTLTGTDTEVLDDAPGDTSDTVDTVDTDSTDGTDGTDGIDGTTDTVGALDGDGTGADEADGAAAPEVDGGPVSAPVPDDEPAPATPAAAPTSSSGDASDGDLDSTVAAVEDTEVVRLLSSVVASVWGELPLDPDDPEGPGGPGPDDPDDPSGGEGPGGAGPSSETGGGTVGAPARQGTSIHDALVERRESRRDAPGGQARSYHSLLGRSGVDTWVRHQSGGSADHAAVGGTELAAPIGFPGSDGELDPLVKAMGSLSLLLAFTGVMVELAHRRQQRGHGVTL